MGRWNSQNPLPFMEWEATLLCWQHCQGYLSWGNCTQFITSKLISRHISVTFPHKYPIAFPYVFSHYSSIHISSLTCMLHALIIIQFKNFALLRMSQSTLFLQVLTSLAITSPYFISSSYCCTTEMEYTVNTQIFLGNF